MPLDLDKAFKEEREPFIEYEVVDENPEKHKDPFIPALEADPTPPEQVLVRIEL